MKLPSLSRRDWLKATALNALAIRFAPGAQAKPDYARIAITLDLEMSREYPQRGITEWDYEKGNLDEATKQYSVEAARVARQRGGVIHFFCVGRVLEQPNVDWLKEIAQHHPIGNHTYDHVNVLAQNVEDIQFRFRRAPWLVEGKTVDQILSENIRLTSRALQQRVGVRENGFRTPGGFHQGLSERADVQRMLLEAGFRWCSSKYPRHPMPAPRQEPTSDVYAGIAEAQAAAQPFIYPSGLVEVPMSPISDVNAFRSHHWKLEWFLRAIRIAVEWAIENRGTFDFLAHPSCLVVEDPEFQAVKLICDLVEQSRGRAKICSLDEIAGELRDES